MDRNLKAQSAMEFFMFVGILLMIFIAFTAILFDRVNTINDKKAVLLGEDIAIKVQKEILLAARVSDGYSRLFTLPQTIEGMNYSVYVSGKEVTVKTPKSEVVRIIPEINGNITKGNNLIHKSNGSIYLN
jgi:hypothetical protein